MASSSVGWALPHHSLIKTIPTDLLTDQSYEGIFSMKSPSQKCLGLCQVDKNQPSTGDEAIPLT